jgi:hypothetical protein
MRPDDTRKQFVIQIDSLLVRPSIRAPRSKPFSCYGAKLRRRHPDPARGIMTTTKTQHFQPPP